MGVAAKDRQTRIDEGIIQPGTAFYAEEFISESNSLVLLTSYTQYPLLGTKLSLAPGLLFVLVEDSKGSFSQFSKKQQKEIAISLDFIFYFKNTKFRKMRGYFYEEKEFTSYSFFLCIALMPYSLKEFP